MEKNLEEEEAATKRADDHFAVGIHSSSTCAGSRDE